MRKQTKIAAMVSAAALLAIGASMTSFAYGWDVEDGQSVYLDRYGDKVSLEWKNWNGGSYWLDENGYLATNQLVEDGDYVYYVDANGLRVTNQWVSVDNEDDISVDGKEVDTLWYYFGANGKATCAKEGKGLVVKAVDWSGGNSKFVFDEDGHMVSGWTYVTTESNGKTTVNTYYLGDENEGNARVGWWKLEPDTDMPAPGEDYEDEEWFYFDGGKAVKGSKGGTKTKYLDWQGVKSYYTFDENGVMIDGWFDPVSTPASPGKIYAGSTVDRDGSISTGWVYTAKPDDEDSSAWFYLVNVGSTKSVAFNYGGDGYLAKVIGGKTYVFDNKGAMVTGLLDLTAADKNASTAKDYKGITAKQLTEGGIYYFSEAAASQGKDGRMMTGKVTVTSDDETNYYYFDKQTGMALTNKIKDGVLYGSDGKRIQADDGNSNQRKILTAETKVVGKDTILEKNTPVIVNSNGRIKESGTVKIDGVTYEVEKYVAKEKAEQ